MLFGRSQEELIALLVALIPAFTVHEFSHAWSAYRLGDPTAKNLGRLTLNPIRHLDLFGILMVLLAGFGWAKPVPVNVANLRNGRRDLALVAAAGPLSNLIMATVAALILRGVGKQIEIPSGVLYGTLVFVWLNIALLFFNLLPIAPLDGFKVVLGWMPEPIAEAFAKTAPWGMMILLVLILLGSFGSQVGLPKLDILETLVTQPTDKLVSLLLGAP